MKHVIRHGLDQEMARKVAEKAIERYGEAHKEFNPQFTWTSPTSGNLSFKAKGQDIKGTVSIVGPDLVIDLKVPFLLGLFAKPAMGYLDKEVNKWVKAAREGKLEL